MADKKEMLQLMYEEYKMFADKYLDKANESRILKATSHGFVTEDSMKPLMAEINSYLKAFNQETEHVL